MIQIIQQIQESWDLEYLEELTIECNPDPQDVVFECIKSIGKAFPKFPRIRRSIGIQSFDNQVLDESGRQYNFPMIQDFLRGVIKLKRDNMTFNLDFIAFGKFYEHKNGNLILWDEKKFQFFQSLVASEWFDGFSVYTLELFPESKWYHQLISDHSHDKY